VSEVKNTGSKTNGTERIVMMISVTIKITHSLTASASFDGIIFLAMLKTDSRGEII